MNSDIINSLQSLHFVKKMGFTPHDLELIVQAANTIPWFLNNCNMMFRIELEILFGSDMPIKKEDINEMLKIITGKAS